MNLVQGHVKTQLIAHDKEVYDIAFSRAGGGRDIFASVGKSTTLVSSSDAQKQHNMCITDFNSMCPEQFFEIPITNRVFDPY